MHLVTSIVVYYFFFVSIRRPPRSTLLPYPPLFRSPTTAQVAVSASSRRTVSSSPHTGSGVPHPGRGHPAASALMDRIDTSGAGDRKSTRLNSSHANISYAVFCLKKKTELSSVSHY